MRLNEGDVVQIERHNDRGEVIEVVLACYRFSKRHNEYLYDAFCPVSGMLDFFGARGWALDVWRNKVTKLYNCPELEDQYGNAIEFGDTVSFKGEGLEVSGVVSVALDENKIPYFILRYLKEYATMYADLHKGETVVLLT